MFLLTVNPIRLVMSDEVIMGAPFVEALSFHSEIHKISYFNLLLLIVKSMKLEIGTIEGRYASI